jgi:hypothetical protein
MPILANGITTSNMMRAPAVTRMYIVYRELTGAGLDDVVLNLRITVTPINGDT